MDNYDIFKAVFKTKNITELRLFHLTHWGKKKLKLKHKHTRDINTRFIYRALLRILLINIDCSNFINAVVN